MRSLTNQLVTTPRAQPASSARNSDDCGEAGPCTIARMRIVVAGGTGFLGRALVARLHAAGHEVVVLSRHPGGPGQVQWDPGDPAGHWTQALEGAGAVVNLTGQPIDRRWTKKYKQELWRSRVLPTRTLAAALRNAPYPPAALVA